MAQSLSPVFWWEAYCSYSVCTGLCAWRIVFLVVADLLAGSGNFRNKGRNLLSYMIFVLSPVFSYGMLWFDRDAYVQYLVEKGTEQTYMDTMVSTAQNWMLPAMIIGVLICAAISGLVGQKLLKKHFEKAGVVYWRCNCKQKIHLPHYI